MTAIASHIQGQQSAKAQQEMINAGAEQERLQTQRQYEQTNQVAQENMAQRHKELLIEQGRLRTIGAESGLTGATQDRIEQEATNTAAQDMATIEANRSRQQEQVRAQGTARQMQAGVQLAGVRRPTALGTALQIAGAVGPAIYKDYDKERQLAPARLRYYSQFGPPEEKYVKAVQG